ncbi:MAG: MFS transporter [SAR202 cluster bacterium]|nr:MFS transporter [SAR202 cluster bacterium]
MPARINIAGRLRPQSELSDAQRARGLKILLWEGVTSSASGGFTSGAFLTSFALLLGAAKFHIGLIAAIPAAMQLVQIGAIIVVERLQMRKIIVWPAYLLSYSTWAVIAFLPLLFAIPSNYAVYTLLAVLVARGVLDAVVTCGWNSWFRAIVPLDIAGRFLSKRFVWNTIGVVLAGFAAAAYVNRLEHWFSGKAIVWGYSAAIVFAAVMLGWLAVYFMYHIPEPRMPDPGPKRLSPGSILTAPFRIANARWLMGFLFLWAITSTMAVPFFAVYMLTRLEMPASTVLALTVATQIALVLSLGIWGQICDQFGPKVALSMAFSMLMVAIVGWVFTTRPGSYFLTAPVLVGLHILLGMASAGMNVSSTTIRMKTAPELQTTSYMMGTSLSYHVGAAIGPVIGGALATLFTGKQILLEFRWHEPDSVFNMPVLYVQDFDFLFIIAFVTGLAALRVLRQVTDGKESARSAVLESLASKTAASYRPLAGKPVIGVASRLHPGAVRRMVPIPGLDTAAGILAYLSGQAISLIVGIRDRLRRKR